MPRHVANINGFKLTGDPNGITELRHKDEVFTRMLFSQAAESGNMLFRGRHDEPYTLKRNSDYTFEVTPGEPDGTYH